MNISTATPAEIDTEIARIQAEINAHHDTIEKAYEAITRYRRSDATYYADAIAKAEAASADATNALPALIAEQLPLVNEFDVRGGWTRWYLVEGGHLHYDVSSFRCSRINTTSHYWLTEYSGTARAEMIELAGERVCTVCFPEAPAATQERPSKLFTKTEAEKAEAAREREDKRTAKALKAQANAITAADGGDLIDVIGHKITTVTAAKSAYSDAVVSLDYWVDKARHDADRPSNYDVAEWDENRVWNQGRYEKVRVATLEALAAKFETTPEAYEAQEAKKIAAKIRRARKEAEEYRAYLGR